ncbi:hypothetical protein NHQ30_005562 [Ciborinia camelliae]|nr:hypothetical protein NHQ30_005562 [Ciborinia camelliae]
MAPQGHRLSMLYSWFFLIIDPISAVIAAYYAYFKPTTYLQSADAVSAPLFDFTIPLSTNIVLTQLASLYLLSAFNEALILRMTSDMRIWNTVMFGLLLADLGHLYSMKGLGYEIYWDVARWNRADLANVGFVYVRLLMRFAFLTDFGLNIGPVKPRAGRAQRD